MEVEKIRELVRLVEESQIQELELSNRGETIRISKNGSGVAVPMAAAPVAPVASTPAAPSPAPAPAPETAAPPESAGATGTEVHSPMVGVFYAASSPDAEPFVRVGDRVEKGTVLCIIEAMKVMNEIESDVSGVVTEVLAENGQPVEFGQTLFRVQE